MHRRNNRMNAKKIIIISLIISFLFVSGIIFVASITAFEGWTDGTVKEGDCILKGIQGDEFSLHFVTKNFPDYQTSVTIMDASKKENLSFFHIEGDFYEPKIEVVIDTQDLRCYEIYDSVIYRKKGEKFKGINISLQTSLIDLEYNNITKEFIDIAKILVAKNEWKWIKGCGSLLVRAGDENIKKTLERYAIGQFTNEDLEVNKNNDITKEDIQAYSKQVLEDKIEKN